MKGTTDELLADLNEQIAASELTEQDDFIETRVRQILRNNIVVMKALKELLSNASEK